MDNPLYYIYTGDHDTIDYYGVLFFRGEPTLFDRPQFQHKIEGNREFEQSEAPEQQFALALHPNKKKNKR